MRTIIVAFVVLYPLSAPGLAGAFDHAPLDRILKAHVRRGRVDYAGLKKGYAQAALEAYVEALGRARVRSMSREAKLAFYLNAYNALVIKAVVDRTPGVTTVSKIDGFFDRTRHAVAGRRVTLNQLENQIIRPTFEDPRIHFALVCAARSCPPLRSAAFFAGSLDRVLQRLTRDFVNDRRHGVRVEKGKVRISMLFKWYADDFVSSAGSVGAFLAKYHRSHAVRLERQRRFDYLPYDWKLNGE